jgi:hypothetical protein
MDICLKNKYLMNKILNLPNLTLMVALCLSSVAAYYSIIGLTAIFAGAVVPVIIMGGMLEVAKITTTVWLRRYWSRAGLFIKLYLVPAVIALALLTSMGIFGFLSKAHMEQGINSGDSQAKLALFDEKIKTQRDNIELARKALTQMDAQVDQMLGRTDSDKGAERAVTIRKQQAKERASLQNDIGLAQKEIEHLNEERAPIAAENRKVEAEVGPIKYIAALIYGDNASQNMLESAVRWVIILLVIVFDPLAIALVLAGNQSKEWIDDEGFKPDAWVADVGANYEHDDGPIDEEVLEQIQETVEELPKGDTVVKTELFPEEPDLAEEANSLIAEIEREDQVFFLPEEEKVDFVQGNYIVSDATVTYNPVVMPEPIVEEVVEPEVIPEPVEELPVAEIETDTVELEDEDTSHLIIPEIELPFVEEEDGYVLYKGMHMSKDALKGMHPELFALKADQGRPIRTDFGSNFPAEAHKGDIFVRVDVLPNRVYKFDGHHKWIEVNKETTDTYLHNQKYLQHLVNMIESGQYDVELLSDNEKAEIEEFLSKKA